MGILGIPPSTNTTPVHAAGNWSGGENANAGASAWQPMESFDLTAAMGLGVNVASGNLLATYKLPSLPGVNGLDQNISLRYNSFDRSSTSWFGDGWTTSIGQGVGLDLSKSGQVTFVDGTGKAWVFTGSGTFTAPPGIDADLVKNGDGTYTLTDHGSQGKLQFDSGGNLTAIQDRSGNQIKFSYGTDEVITNTENEQTSVVPTGSITTFTYPGGTGLSAQTTKSTAGNLASLKVDGLATTTSLTYDSSHDLTQITDELGNVTKVAYVSGSAGQVASVTRVTNKSAGTGPTWSFSYGTSSTTVTDPNSHTVTYGFDSSGRITSVTDGLGRTSHTTWTADNHVATTAPPSGATTSFTYDSLNNLTQVTLPTGASESCQYGNTSFPYQPSACTDAQGNTTNVSYNSQGLVSQVTDPNGKSSSYSYNSNGTLASETDENGHTTTHTYTSLGLPQQDTPPSPLGTTQYAFNASHLESAVTDGNGKQTTYGYGGEYQAVASEGFADGTSITYAHDADGNPTSMTDATGTTTYTYDALNELTQKKLPNGQTVSYTYDSAGNLLTKTDTGGTTTYSYNANDAVTGVTDRGGRSYSVGYDQDGNQTSIGFPSGVVTEAMTYNAAGQLTNIQGTNSSNQTLTSLTYSYTNPSNGKQTLLPYSVTDTAGDTTSYQYDSSNQLTQATKVNGANTLATYAYTYDPVGNLTSRTANGTQTTFSYNAADELTSASGGMTASYAYDGNGDRTSATVAGKTEQISVNDAGQITSITPSSGSAIPYSYTGTGEQQRVSAGSTNYQYDGSGLSKQTDSLGDTYFTTLPDGTLLSETIPSGSAAGTYYYLSDGAGSTAAVTDSGGQVQDSYSYDPMGNATSTGSVPNPFSFQGWALDSQTGYYYTGSGYYDPANGQAFGCQDNGWVDPGEDKCGPDEHCEPEYGYCNSPAGPYEGSVGPSPAMSVVFLSITPNNPFAKTRGPRRRSTGHRRPGNAPGPRPVPTPTPAPRPTPTPTPTRPSGPNVAHDCAKGGLVGGAGGAVAGAVAGAFTGPGIVPAAGAGYIGGTLAGCITAVLSDLLP